VWKAAAIAGNNDLLEIPVPPGDREVAHTSVEISKVLLTPVLASARESPWIGGVTPRTNLWGQSVSRIEIDQRSREARLRSEQVDRVFVLRATVTRSRLRRLLYLSSLPDNNDFPVQFPDETRNFPVRERGEFSRKTLFFFRYSAQFGCSEAIGLTPAYYLSVETTVAVEANHW
jgi:hypothetical protein